MTRPLEAWDSLVRSLAEEVPEATFSAWVEPISAVEEHGGLRLCCPTPFHRDRVRKRLLPYIEAGLRALGAESIPVALAVDKSAPRRARPVLRAPRRHATPTEAENSAAQSGPSGESAHPGGMVERSPSAAPGREGPPENQAAISHRAAEAPAQPGATAAAPARGALHRATFGTLIEGNGNALARAAGVAIARGRQLQMCPLVIVGPAGMGKSHLAFAIANEARRVSNTRVRLVSAEQFTNEVTKAIRAKNTEAMKARFREVDLLIVEDIDFVAGKKATQEELDYTLDALARTGGRVVLTAKRMLREIPNLDPDLLSRMSGGLCTELEAPDRGHRRSILRAKAAGGGFRIPDECLDALADAPFGSVRALEATLIQLVANGTLLARSVDLDGVRAALARVGIAPARERSILEIASEAAAFFGSSFESLASPSRRRDVTWPRQVAMYLCHRLTPASNTEIGRLFGRGHSPVRNAIDVVGRALLENPPQRYQVEALIKRLDPEAQASLDEPLAPPKRVSAKRRAPKEQPSERFGSGDRAADTQ